MSTIQGRKMNARYAGSCRRCGARIAVGDEMIYAQGSAYCLACAGVAAAAAPAPAPAAALITYRPAATGGGAWHVALDFSQVAAREQLKGLGWRWHGKDCRPSCPACALGIPQTDWWTTDGGAVAPVREHCDAPAQAAVDACAAVDAASRAADAVTDVPCPAGLAYMPFQRAGIEWLRSHPRTLLADEMGLGKTIQALGLINSDAAIRRTLVVCPATLRRNWVREASKWLCRPTLCVVVEDAKGLAAALAAVGDRDLLVSVNFELLIKGRGAVHYIALIDFQGDFIVDATGKPVKANKTNARKYGVPEASCRRYQEFGGLLDAISAVAWDLVVVDEAHKIKNPKAQQTRALLGVPARNGEEAAPGLVQRTSRAVLASGSPITNRVVELFPLLNALRPDVWSSFFGYAKRYCDAQQNKFGWDFSGASHLDELQRKLRTEGGGTMIRRLKSDVLTELPAKRRQLIVLEPNGAAIEAEAARAAAHEERAAALQATADVARLQGDDAAWRAAIDALTVARGEAFADLARARHDVSVAKAPYVAEHVAEMLDGGVEKVIVFCHHHDVAAILMQAFAPYGVVRLTGEDAADARDASVQRFQNDAGCRVIVCGIQAAGVGITLTASSNVVFGEISWVPSDLQQAEDRAHRIGQRDAVLVQHIVFDGTIDARMAEVIIEKMDIADRALDKTAVASAPTVTLDTSRDASATSSVELDASLIEAAVARPAREAAEKTFSPEVRDALLVAMQALAEACDHAQTRDGVGFSAQWVSAGHWLAGQAVLDDRMAAIAMRVASWHRVQLGPLAEDCGISLAPKKAARAARPSKAAKADHQAEDYQTAAARLEKDTARPVRRGR